MVGIGDDGEEDPPFCRGCGLVQARCGGSCERGGDGATPRFCGRCGWRLREIAVVPGVGSLWCRTHGVIED